MSGWNYTNNSCVKATTSTWLMTNCSTTCRCESTSYNHATCCAGPIIYATQNLITYSLKEDIAKFGDVVKQAATKKMRHPHDRVFVHIDLKTISAIERKGVWNQQPFVTKRKDGLIKGRHCENGNPQCQWMAIEQVSSPTVITELKMINSIIEEK